MTKSNITPADKYFKKCITEALNKVYTDKFLEMIDEDELEDVEDSAFEYGTRFGRNQLRAELRAKIKGGM